VHILDTPTTTTTTTTNTNTVSTMTQSRGGNKARKNTGKRSNSGGTARKYVFQPGERTIPTKVMSATVATGEKSPMARVAVPVPGIETDPAGVRVLGWKITASSTDPDLRFNLGARFGKNVTIHVPVEQRPNGKQTVPLILDVIGTVEQTYAIMFTNTVYYIVDALAH
jgi:hypothetical protein